MDSFTLVWLQHDLKEQHGVVIAPQFEDMHFFTSINGIREYLIRRFPDRVAPVEDNVDGRYPGARLRSLVDAARELL